MSLSGFAAVKSRALIGLAAPVVCVEVHLANGAPMFTIVGLAETEVKESRERVRAAIQNAGLSFPHNKRITVNLAPADLPKDTGRFDLPIALGILAASQQLDAKKLEDFCFAGELSLAGELRAIKGALAMQLGLANEGIVEPWVLPVESAKEAALLPGAQIYAAQHLLDVVRAFLPQANPSAVLQSMAPRQLAASNAVLDFADVKAQAAAKRALEIAAAGNHSVLMVGAPGSGKTMLAERFAGIMPTMSQVEALQSAAVLSLKGRFQIERWGVRPTCNPHHTASAVALVGGGSPPRPGEISLAHHGVLFLDELPEFAKTALEALREPLEKGLITIARAQHSTEFPARFVLIGAMNPCPCGYFGSSLKSCRCTPDQVSRYQGRLSGPLLDRIDVHIEVPSLPADELLGGVRSETSSEIRERVEAARMLAIARQGCPNQALSTEMLNEHCALGSHERQFLTQAATRLGWSARSTHRVLKLARTIADLKESVVISVVDLAEAIQYRRALKNGHW